MPLLPKKYAYAVTAPSTRVSINALPAGGTFSTHSWENGDSFEINIDLATGKVTCRRCKQTLEGGINSSFHKCEPQGSPGAWSCPRCGTNPGGTKNALNDEDAKTGCFRCGSALVRV